MSLSDRSSNSLSASTPSNASPGIAAALEIGFGIFLQTYGIGHIYAGRVVRGILVMGSYWLAQAINFLLAWVAIGYVTAPLTFLAYTVFSTLWAARTARRGG